MTPSGPSGYTTMKKFITLAVTLAALINVSFAEMALQDTEYRGDVETVVADESDTAAFSSEIAGRIILAGFASQPIVLDVTDEAAPKLLVNYPVMESEGTFAAYVGIEAGVEARVVGVNAIVDVTEIIVE